MGARELRDKLMYEPYDERDAESVQIILRALSLLASAEWSSEEIVLELGGFVDFLHERGHDGDAQLVDDARARIVADAQEKERLRRALSCVISDHVTNFELIEHYDPWLRDIVQPIIDKLSAEVAVRAARQKEGA